MVELSGSEVRGLLGHPVVDADGHLVEYLPLVRQFLVEDVGEDLGSRFDFATGLSRSQLPASREKRRAQGVLRGAWWGLPARNSLDRATAALPNLMYNRLDDIGIDLAFLYPTYGLSVLALEDPELRPAMARAINRYVSEVYRECRDRLQPVAVIPMFNPLEAIEELDHAVVQLGLKAIVMAGIIPREVEFVESSKKLGYVDCIGHDNVHDYDPVWERCLQLGVTPTFHSFGYGWGSRTSTINYMYNHIGNFAAAGEATARALFFGGAPSRFPDLNWAFQEGGAAWGINLYSDIVGHFSKRSRTAIQEYDPAMLDRNYIRTLYSKYGTQAQIDAIGGLDQFLDAVGSRDGIAYPDGDEFADSGASSIEEIQKIFCERYFFGCEADDPLNGLAFRSDLFSGHSNMKAMFASDIGHWDVRNMDSVLADAWSLVLEGHLSLQDFEAFTFGNVVDLFGSISQDFFDETAVADSAKRHLARSGP